jgi:hypothetical protein
MSRVTKYIMWLERRRAVRESRRENTSRKGVIPESSRAVKVTTLSVGSFAGSHHEADHRIIVDDNKFSRVHCVKEFPTKAEFLVLALRSCGWPREHKA